MNLLIICILALVARITLSLDKLGNVTYVSPQEISALYDLYVSTNGSAWDCESSYYGVEWDFSVPNPNPCSPQWMGIWCYWDVLDDGYKHISMLSLGYCNMYGSIPESISNLTLLTTFQLNNNYLTKSIPDSLSTMVMLDTLNLEDNQLTGTIPQYMFLTMELLVQVLLDTNHLHGPIPPLGNLSSLMTFMLYDNKLTGTIPDALFDMPMLSHLDLSVNRFNGTLSADIGKMSRLNTLTLSDNDFYGTLPNAAFCQLELYYLYLDSNSFVGSIPDCIGHNLLLDTLHLNFNAFIGSIPDSFANLTNLEDLNLEANLLTGSLPSYIGDLGSQLVLLSLANNHFHGSVPDSYCQLSGLYSYFIGANHLTGTLPSCLDGTHYKSLQTLNMSNCFFHGQIPENVSTIEPLVLMILNNNQLTGAIPSTFCSAQRWNTVHLQINQLTGPLPDCLMTMANEGELWVHNNQLTGRLPNVEWLVQVVDVSANLFSGSIEFAVYYPSRLLSLTFSDNLLSGPLPLNWNNFTVVESVFVNNNLMTGPLDTLFASGSDPNVLNIDISHNRFTGTLPPHLFTLPSLESFAAVSNCLHGSLPAAQICSLVNLSTLALDGLMAAPSCQDRLVPYSRSYEIQKSVSGGVPACLLYDMESLQILHLSGNGIDGTIPSRSSNTSNDVISLSLLDLSLSHNELTGTIPLPVQRHTWQSLDLSYNKLTGTLKGDIYAFHDDDASDEDQPQLSLQVNRLSGPVPAALLPALNISILDGNLFSCLFDRSDLPRHDSQSGTYECGSNSFNYSVYIWLIFAIVMGVFAVLLWLTRRALIRESVVSSDGNALAVDGNKAKKRKTTLVYVSQHITAWQLVFTPTDDTTTAAGNPQQLKQRRSLIALGVFVSNVRAGFLRLTLFIVCFLMPLYALLSQFFFTYNYEYAWVLSTSYLSGLGAGATVTVLLILLLVFCFALYSHYYSVYVKTVGQKTLVNPIGGSFGATTKAKRWPLLWYLSLALVAVLNVILVVGINVAYVYVIITYNANIVRVTQVSVAAFKLGWNSSVLRRMLKWTRKFLNDADEANEEVEVPLTRMSEHQADVGSQSTIGSGSSLKARSHAGPAQHIGVEVCLVLFNNIAAPFIATLFVSSNCFYNVIVPPPKVEVTYAYTACTHWLETRVSVECVAYGDAYRQTSYSPPFTYSYQCSSTIVSYYAAIYVFMLLFIGFLNPAAQCAIKLLQQLSNRKGRVYALLNHCLPVLLRSRKKDHPLSPGETTDSTMATNTAAAGVDLEATSSGSSHSISALRFFHASVLVDLDANISKLFECDLFIVRLLNLLAIQLTFGAVFPPLAVVVCVALFNFSYYYQILIGRFVNVAHSKGHKRVSELLAQQCDHAALLFSQSVWIVVPFAVIFYSLFVLDTLGDDQGGWKAALWAPALLCVAPLLIWYLQTRDLCCFGESAEHRRGNSKTEEDVRQRFNTSDESRATPTGMTRDHTEGWSKYEYIPVDDSGEEGQVMSSSNPLLNKLIGDTI